MSIYDDGTDLTMTAIGAYDFSALTPSVASIQLGANASASPGILGGVFGWETTTAANSFRVEFSKGLTGTGSLFSASSVSTSSPFFFYSTFNFQRTYYLQMVDTAPLIGSVNETAVFHGATLSSLGMVEEETVFVTWAGDSAIIQTFSVPEPSHIFLVSFGALGLGSRRFRTV
ncbi:PEP-CTERM sorting domain-containing protein [Roseibacillus persicicus]|uniref:PEP-CTERM sorting domain-containing protein n=1 Tax=Roseibacillus persicicus TaxID=454148 RepID=UPI0016775EBA|nr:PEP-CTERM sorting domain-containing protein [Roseibacillus persicicus]